MSLSQLYLGSEQSDHAGHPVDLDLLAVAELRAHPVEAHHASLAGLACDHRAVLQGSTDLEHDGGRVTNEPVDGSGEFVKTEPR